MPDKNNTNEPRGKREGLFDPPPTSREMLVEAMEIFHPEGHWPLIAIRKRDETIVAKDFLESSTRAADTDAWCQQQVDDGFDLYFAINPLRRPLGRKANKSDVLEARWLQVDCDPPAGQQEIRGWRSDMFEKLCQGGSLGSKPTVIINSGRGYWAFWKLQEPVKLDVEGIARVEAANRALREIFRGDSAQNVDRICRLPGYRNSKTGEVARIDVHNPERVYKLEAFPTETRWAHDGPDDFTYAKFIDDAEAQETFKRYLEKQEPAVEGNYGRTKTLNILNRAMDFGLRFEMAARLIVESDWNKRCRPPWGLDELEHHFRGLDNSRKDPLGCRHPEVARQQQRWAKEAAKLAAKYFEQPDETTAEESESQTGAKADADEKKVTIKPTPYAWPSATEIPSRDFVYGQHLIRKFVSTTIAPGAVGKSSLAVAEALSMVSGLALLHGIKPLRPLNVWWWNGEDPPDELDRRVAAAARHYGIERGACPGRLFVDSGRKLELVVATTTNEGTVIAKPLVDALKEAIVENKIDVFVVDPFVSSHRVSENDNNAIDAVAREWASIAEACNCAIELVHHARKTNGAEVGVEDARGASAQIAAARDVRTLNRMTSDEARKAGVENHRSYFRVDQGDKSNMAPPAAGATWFFMKSVDLHNPTDGRPGDKVGVVTPWEWPQPLEGVTDENLHAVQVAIDGGFGGQPWRYSSQAGEAWAGRAVANVLGLNVNDPRDKAKINGLLKAWIEGGALVKDEMVVNRKGKTVPTVKVGRWVFSAPSD